MGELAALLRPVPPEAGPGIPLVPGGHGTRRTQCTWRPCRRDCVITHPDE
jgi:hypothetical protein